MPKPQAGTHDREAGMIGALLKARLRVRLDTDERGFTIVETVIAITVIFASLTALAYTATAGFSAIAYGRERIQATGLASKIVEEVRGKTYANITAGLKSTDLTGDSRIVNCSGTYRFETCSGEKIVSTAGLANTSWLVPHKGSTTAGTLTANWAVYVTNETPSTTPYRLTVIVTWASAAHPNAANNLVRVQSLVWSPTGCVSADTHPFAAPCQPFFYGNAEAPQPQLTIAGTIHGGSVNWSQSVIKGVGVDANLQQEQVSELQGSYSQSGVTMTDGGGTTSTAGATVTTTNAADSDPAGSTPTYANSTLSSGGADTLTAQNSDCCNTIGLTVTAPAGDTAQTSAAVAAGGSNVCPPPTATAETDTLPCTGSRILQGGTMTATSPLTHVNTSLGTANIASMFVPTSIPTTTVVDRQAVSGQDGYVRMTATRRVGTINIGGLPSGMANPAAGWDPSGTPVYEKYCVTIDAYQDTVTAQTGTSTAAPSASVTSGTFWYYNSSLATPAYSSKSITDATLNSLAVTCTSTQTIGGQTVVWTVSVASGGVTQATTASTSNGTGTTRTSAEASVTPPSLLVAYTVQVAGTVEMNYTITLDLGLMRARGVYGPPPAAG